MGIVAAILSYALLAIGMPKVDLTDVGEVSRIAASIATGHGFSSPFAQPTGPSALVPPVYPYLLAGIFRLFGVFTETSYWVAAALNVIVHACSCVILYRAAGETFGRRAGWFAAMALASFPLLFEPLVLLHILGGYKGQGLFIPPNLIWYTHLSELSIVVLILLTLRRTHWSIYGIGWGIACLVNPGVLAIAPVFWGWRLWQDRQWRDFGLAVATMLICVTPWLIRNFVVFHHPVFIRDGFGIELRAGNQPGGRGLKSYNLHPWSSADELGRVVKMGEPEYARVSGEEAMAWIRSAPGAFALNSIRRIGYYWLGTPPESHHLGRLRFLKYLPPLVFSLLASWGVGCALRDKNREALLFASVLFLYPLVYYVTHTSTGYLYQYPVQPEMLALAVSAFFRKKTHEQAESADVEARMAHA
jgi:hypothetical protein